MVIRNGKGVAAGRCMQRPNDLPSAALHATPLCSVLGFFCVLVAKALHATP